MEVTAMKRSGYAKTGSFRLHLRDSTPKDMLLKSESLAHWQKYNGRTLINYQLYVRAKWREDTTKSNWFNLTKGINDAFEGVWTIAVGPL